MNAIEIEQAISELAEQPFDGTEFPYLFLESFGNKETTLKKLRSGASNKSDLGGVLQTNNIHIVVCDDGEVSSTLQQIKASQATKKSKVKFGLATDGKTLEAEDYNSGETVVCEYPDLPNHFGFFLPLAGISTVKQIRDNAFDIKATSRLNKLYVQLLEENPDWAGADRREDMNHFMARLIFCFFAEDTNIFAGEDLFTKTIEQMSERDSSDTHEVIFELFRSMNTKIGDRKQAKIARWADAFPYVNGGLFAGDAACPTFSKIARSYLLHVGNLDWTKINPDIFGSMIQAIADDEERGELGMHYTSVPNILKVLNPLFLDDIRSSFQECGDNARKLLNLRKRITRIRIFDPACGSGNFLVIAYRELRAIENEINEQRGESGRRSEIPVTNFRGIELRNFSAEIARLALIIAEYQCDVTYLGQKEALIEFLPLSADNWITCGNALRLDWLSVCPPTGTGVKQRADDLFETPLDQSEIDFENEGGETYICGNPPYLGSTWQNNQQKADLEGVFKQLTKQWKSLDYVSGWFMKAADYGRHTKSTAAFVTTNSICQGQQVPILWPLIFDSRHFIHFAHTSFNWANLASHNAGVTVAIVGISNHPPAIRRLYGIGVDKEVVVTETGFITAYLTPGKNIIVASNKTNMNGFGEMVRGNTGNDGGYLYVSPDQIEGLGLSGSQKSTFLRKVFGSSEYINGNTRYCIWIEDENLEAALQIPSLYQRIQGVKEVRLKSRDLGSQKMAVRSHQFREMNQSENSMIVIPRVSSENREYLPVGLLKSPSVISDRNFALYDAPLWYMALIASRLHWVWIGTVCVRMRTDFSYSNTLGWNTFPVPTLTEKNKADLTRCAENILLARESHFPATIADLYSPEKMPQNLRAAHEQNDEVLERIYIGRCFKNDTERLEKLFDLYTKMTSGK
jgi:hypothetical protein